MTPILSEDPNEVLDPEFRPLRTSKAQGRQSIYSLWTQELRVSTPMGRVPEPNLVMDNPDGVAAFDRAGDKILTPLYHFNAVRLSRMIPRGGTLLDLGCGSGRFLRHLARVRPDIRLVGVDLSEAMLAKAESLFRSEGVKNQVEWRQGDMTDLAPFSFKPIDVVSSIFSLHHLRSLGAVELLFQELTLLRRRTGAGLWIFDHYRPSHPRSAEQFPHVFSPGATPLFQIDSTNSLRASFRMGEIVGLFEQCGLGSVQSRQAPNPFFYQTHRLPKSAAFSPLVPLNRVALSLKHRAQAALLGQFL